MTTATASSGPVPDLRAWAAAQLDLGRSATPAEVRAALLRQLPDDDFLPPFRQHQAACVLLAPADGAAAVLRHGQACADEEDRLRTEMDEFIGAFFATEPRQRRQWWQGMTERCAFSPPLAARIHSLERGLHVTRPELGDPDVVTLAEHVCELFVLRPAARAVRRQELLREMRPSVARWQAAARELRLTVAPVAALAPALIDELADWEHRLQKERQGSERGPARSASPARQRVGPGQPNTVLNVAASNGQPSGAKRGATWPVILAIFVIINLLRVAFSGSGSSTPRYTPPPPVPTWRWTPPPQGKPGGLSNEELQKMIRDLQGDPPVGPNDRKKPKDDGNLPP